MPEKQQIRLIAVEEPGVAARNEGKTWRIGVLGNGNSGRLLGWEDAWFSSYSACSAAIAFAERYGGSYKAYQVWKRKQRGKGEPNHGR